MLEDPLFNKALYLIIIIAILHVTAITLEFYWTIWWFDVIMHFLGGIFIGMMGILMYRHFAEVRRLFAGRSPVFVAFAAALGVGILWEVYEYFTGQTAATFLSYPLDTAKDLVMDSLGGIAAGVLVGRKKENKEISN